MIYDERPENFSPKFEIASCYLMHDGKFVLLRRLAHKSQGGKWGVPAGKLESEETPLEAAVREITEETGVRVDSDQLRFLETVFVRYPEYDFVYHMFSLPLLDKPEIVLQPDEHEDSVWVSPSDAYTMDLVDGLADCIRRSVLIV